VNLSNSAALSSPAHNLKPGRPQLGLALVFGLQLADWLTLCADPNFSPDLKTHQNTRNSDTIYKFMAAVAKYLQQITSLNYYLYYY